MSHCHHCGADVPSAAANCGWCGAPASSDSQTGPGADRGNDGLADRARSPSDPEQSRGTPRNGNATVPSGPTRTDNSRRVPGPSQRENAPGPSGLPRNENATGPSGSPGNENTPSPPGTAEPTGVKALAAILALFGGVQVLLGLTSLGFGGQASRVGASSAGSLLSILGVVIVLFGGGYLLVAFGLWTFRAWGWAAGVVLAGVGAIGSVFGIGLGATGPGLVLGLLVNAGVLFYLLTSRDAYRYVSRVRHGTAQLGADIV